MTVEIRSFEGDLSQLRSFLFQTWSAVYQGELFIDFSEDFLAWHLFGPQATRAWTVAAYEGSKLGGFVWALPMSVSVSGQRFHATEAGLLAVSPELRGRNVALSLARKLVQLHEERGYGLSMGFFDGEHRSMPLYRLLLESGLLQMHQVATVPAEVKVRILDLPSFLRARPTELVERIVLRATQVLPFRRVEGVRQYMPEDLSSCLDLLRSGESRLEQPYLYEEWTEAEFARQLQGSPCVTTLVAARERGSGALIRGFVNYFRVEAVQNDRMLCGVIDHLHSLPEDVRTTRLLLSAAFCHMQEQGCTLAVFPMRSGRKTRGLTRAGFVTLPRKMLCCLVGFPGGPSARPLKDFYVRFR